MLAPVGCAFRNKLRLGHATISTTLDLYSHVTPGLQEAAAAGFDKMVLSKREKEAVQNDY